MIKLKHIICTMLLTGFLYASADHLSDRLTFTSRLQAPAGVTTNGNGVGAFMLNSTRDTLFFSISATGLTSKVNGYHIHNGRTGGNVIIDFDGKVVNQTVRSMITGAQLKMLLSDLIESNLYVAVHTENNPAVEIFGLIKLETDWGYAAALDGTQAGSAASGVGHASLVFGMKGDTCTIRVVTKGLTGKIGSAHLHYGKAGQSGAVAIDLDHAIAPDSLSLVGGVTLSPSDWTMLAVALQADSIYLNVHTALFPGGEIRGQVRSTKTLRFDSWLSQAAILAGGGTIGKASSAYGVSTLWLNNAMDTLKFTTLFKGLTSNALYAHFHNAEFNMSGGVVKDLTITGNTISGMWTKYDASEPLTDMLISELLRGALYYVIHTDSNPNGEIRGQVYRTAREGLIAELDGMQAGTNSMALGTAVVSYDRDRTNLHYMASYNGISSTVSDSHFHKAVKGQAGGVVYDLGTPVNNGYYSYWTSAGGFNNQQSLALRRGDSIYLNIHTTNFANGEIRGQLMRYYRISKETKDTSMSSGLASISKSNNVVSVYPNPVSNKLNATLENNGTGDYNMVILDLTGKTILAETISELLNHTATLDVSGLKTGLYVIEIRRFDEVIGRSKFIKE